MKNKIFLLAAVSMEFLTIKIWFSCVGFRDELHLTQQNFLLHLEDLIHTDKEIPVLLVRFFHNKVSVFVFDFLRHYLYFFDVSMLATVLSPLGLFGFIYGTWIAVTEKKKVLLWLVFLVVLLPTIEVVFYPSIHFPLKLLLLFLPHQLLSVYGIWKFLSQEKGWKRYVGMVFLMVLSLLWLTFIPKELIFYCIEKK